MKQSKQTHPPSPRLRRTGGPTDPPSFAEASAERRTHRPEEKDQLVYAGFWIRVWASLIDSVLACLIVFPLLGWVYGSGYFQEYTRLFELFFEAVQGQVGVERLQELSSLQTLQSGPLDFLISYVLPAAAVVLFWIYRSATPGKMAIQARIVDASTGLQPSNGQLVVRYIGYFISLIPAGLGFLWIALDTRKQGWHDKIAGTVVVRAVRGPSGRTARNAPSEADG